jgi:hypothetical protein
VSRTHHLFKRFNTVTCRGKHSTQYRRNRMTSPGKMASMKKNCQSRNSGCHMPVIVSNWQNLTGSGQ